MEGKWGPTLLSRGPEKKYTGRIICWIVFLSVATTDCLTSYSCRYRVCVCVCVCMCVWGCVWGCVFVCGWVLNEAPVETFCLFLSLSLSLSLCGAVFFKRAASCVYPPSSPSATLSSSSFCLMRVCRLYVMLRTATAQERHWKKKRFTTRRRDADVCIRKCVCLCVCVRAGHFRWLFICSTIKNDCFHLLKKLIAYFFTYPI